jgi:beta-glucosidase
MSTRTDASIRLLGMITMQTFKLSRWAFSATAALWLLAGAHANAELARYPFQDTALAPEKRIDNIISLLTLDEKIGMLSIDSGVKRLGIPSFGVSEGIHGLVQRGTNEQGAPIPTTQFPQPPGMGASWNPNLVRSAAEIEATEARYITQSERYLRPTLMLWGPQADLARDPRWGRSEEVYSEDPFLAGTMVTAFVKGLQGDDPSYWRAAALLKHFLANSNENGRGNSSSNFDERLFHEYYSVPFRMGFEDGGARALMASYNAWNGVPMGVHPVLKSLVIDKWGADVVSGDGGAIANLAKLYKRYPNQTAAVAAALKAGINQYLDTYKDEMRQALDEGIVAESDIDAALRRKFRVTIRLGLIDPPEHNPYAGIKDGPAPWLSEKHRALSLRLALESIVLLKNANHVLPLVKTGLKSIAVIGPLADSVHGDWYGGIPPYAITPLAGIRAAVGPGVTINYAADNAGDAAVKAARASDVAIVVVGNDPTCGPNMAHEWTEEGTKPCTDPGDGREGRDRKTLALKQEALVKQVLSANPKTVMVLVSSFPYTIDWSQKHVPAIVHTTHSSQDEGTALARVLFGDFNPGGHLVSTWPMSMDQLPPMMDYDIRHGRTYMYFRGKPLYPFGYGLSYTTFKYSNLRTSTPYLAANGALTIDVDVSNSGKIAGDTVVQLYVHHPASKVDRPKRALVGFERVTLQPGATRTVHIPLKASQLAYWDAPRGAMRVETGTVNLMIGESSSDIKLVKVLPIKNASP